LEIIEGVVRNYAWGSTTAIPELIGRPVTSDPVAELWLGAHPSAPALVGPDAEPLDALIAADPNASLGPALARDFANLPFLLKVLAAAEPLSLQAHPSSAEAAAGFDREEAAGVPIDAADRSFKDRHHKPELVCALSEFEALCGFREPARTLELLATIDTPALDMIRNAMQADSSPAGMRGLLETLLTLESSRAAALVEAVVGACRTTDDAPFAAEREMAVKLGGAYPGDAGVVIALLLNHLTLQPGEALFLGAGNLHAYLRGTAVEVMASSDNVLRGGLTPKHVDVATLLEVVDATAIIPKVQRPKSIDGVVSYRVPISDFSLDRIEVDGATTLPSGPHILLCIDGSADCLDHTLDRGTAAWVPAEDGPVEISGRATIFRAGAGVAATGEH